MRTIFIGTLIVITVTTLVLATFLNVERSTSRRMREIYAVQFEQGVSEASRQLNNAKVSHERDNLIAFVKDMSGVRAGLMVSREAARGLSPRLNDSVFALRYHEYMAFYMSEIDRLQMMVSSDGLQVHSQYYDLLHQDIEDLLSRFSHETLKDDIGEDDLLKLLDTWYSNAQLPPQRLNP